MCMLLFIMKAAYSYAQYLGFKTLIKVISQWIVKYCQVIVNHPYYSIEFYIP